MRSLVVMAMLAASLAHAGWRDYSEVRDLKISADGIAGLEVDAGAGSLEVTGVPGGRNIVVVATITIENANDDEAGEIIASDLTLMLERDGDRAQLKARFDRADWEHGANATISLEVQVPIGVSLKVHDIEKDLIMENDGSGSVSISGLRGRVEQDS